MPSTRCRLIVDGAIDHAYESAMTEGSHPYVDHVIGDSPPPGDLRWLGRARIAASSAPARTTC